MKREDRRDDLSMQFSANPWETTLMEGGRHESMLGDPSEGMKFPKEEVKRTEAICSCFIILLSTSCCVNITFQSHTHYLL